MSHLHFPINTVSELSTLLSMPIRDLWRLAKNTDKSYFTWKEPKSSGGFRSLCTPDSRLKEVQKKLHKLVFSKIIHSRFSHYGLKKKSNVTNASEHYGNDVIFAFDLKSFFPSIRPERVRKALIDEVGCPAPLASLITKLVTLNYQLPQGAPTSTDIANIVTFRLQRRLYSLAKQWGIKKFTIYADDITFSGNNIPHGFMKLAKKIVREEGYKIHPEKGGVFDKSGNQIITGINITHGLTVGKMKKIWRAERHQIFLRYLKGQISTTDFDSSEERFNSRIVYSKFIKKSGLKVADNYLSSAYK